MRRIELKELQELELNILCEFDKFCVKNSLRYGITSGTLLGAVRHGGFIPWDDDIDVVMPRSDYEIFKELFSKEEGIRYGLASPYNNSEYIYEYIKVMDLSTKMIEMPLTKKIETHVYIDVFPVDGFPDNKIKQRIHLVHVKIYQYLYAILKRAKYKINKKQNKSSFFWKIIYRFNQKLPPYYLIEKLERVAKMYSYENSNYVGVATGQWMKEILKKEEYDLSNQILFENRLFYTYKNPEIYLHSLYGDFIKLPPIEQRVSHDNIVWIED